MWYSTACRHHVGRKLNGISNFALVSGLLGGGKYQDPNHGCQATRLQHGCMRKASCRAVNAGQHWRPASCAPFVIIQELIWRSHELTANKDPSIGTQCLSEQQPQQGTIAPKMPIVAQRCGHLRPVEICHVPMVVPVQCFPCTKAECVSGAAKGSNQAIQEYLGYAVKRCADVYNVEALLVLCIDAEDRFRGRGIYQHMVDVPWTELLLVLCCRCA